MKSDKQSGKTSWLLVALVAVVELAAAVYFAVFYIGSKELNRRVAAQQEAASVQTVSVEAEVKAPPVAVEPEPIKEEEVKAEAAVDEVPVPENTPTEEVNANDAYLAANVGREIPILYKGKKRMVTLVAFDDESVTIKTVKSIRLLRSQISEEQWSLWK